MLVMSLMSKMSKNVSFGQISVNFCLLWSFCVLVLSIMSYILSTNPRDLEYWNENGQREANKVIVGNY